MVVVGVDEAGIGCMAGPLVVVAAAFDTASPPPDGVADSKRLSPAQRENLIDDIYSTASWLVIAVAHAAQINERGSVWAIWEDLVGEVLGYSQDHGVGKIIVDGTRMICGFRGVHYEAKADAKYPEVSAASVVAKYVQTSAMEDLHDQDPRYGFKQHNGYGTSLHMDMLEEHGPSSQHRLFYKPIKRYIETHPDSTCDLRQLSFFNNGHTVTVIK